MALEDLQGPHLPAVRRLAAHEWPTYRDLRLRALADAPDAFGRTLEEECARPESVWSERLASAAESPLDLPLVAEKGGRPIGLAWGRIESATPDVASAYQMWVDASARRSGAGRMLLDAIIDWAIAARARYLDLGVTCGDSPAMRLYVRAGFEPFGQPEALRAGLSLLAQPMRLVLSGITRGGSGGGSGSRSAPRGRARPR